MPTAMTRKTESDSPPQVDDLLPLIAQSRQSGDALDVALVRRLSSKAAAALGAMPKRRRKRWTGWLDGTHFWHGRKAVLPGGQVVVVEGVLRGEALVSWDDPLWLEGIRHQVVRIEDLSVYKTPAAIWLGKLKSGCKERKSEVKAAASRRNGCSPCRDGKRRGKPAKSAILAPPLSRPAGSTVRTPSFRGFEEAVAFYSQPQPR